MAEEFVSFEIAKKLKGKGFREKCLHHYNNNDILTENYSKCYCSANNIFTDNTVDAPTIYQVLKWMREEKNIHIAVDIMKAYPAGNLIYWGYNIVLVDKYEVYHHDWNSDSYEEAAIAGIEYVLDNLI